MRLWPLRKQTPSPKHEARLYLFMAPLYGGRASASALQLGARSFVEHYIAESEFEALFGGYMAHRIDGTHYIGVWSVRMASRMRRIMRERGAIFTVIREPMPGFAVDA